MTLKIFGNKLSHIQTEYENIPLKKCKKITAHINGANIEIKGKRNIERFMEMLLVKACKCDFTTYDED